MDRRENALELIRLHEDRAHELGWRPLTSKACRQHAKHARTQLDREGWREAEKIVRAEGES